MADIQGTPITGLTRQFDILVALTQQLQAITPANGYAYDLSASVYRGITLFGDDTPVPCVSILEAPRPGIQSPATTDKARRLTSWELLIQGWAADNKTNPLDPVYPLKASVERQLARVVQQSGNGVGGYQYPDEALFGPIGGVAGNARRISGMVIGPGVCRPPDAKISTRAFFFLPVTIQYSEDLSAPFV